VLTGSEVGWVNDEARRWCLIGELAFECRLFPHVVDRSVVRQGHLEFVRHTISAPPAAHGGGGVNEWLQTRRVGRRTLGPISTVELEIEANRSS